MTNQQLLSAGPIWLVRPPGDSEDGSGQPQFTKGYQRANPCSEPHQARAVATAPLRRWCNSHRVVLALLASVAAAVAGVGTTTSTATADSPTAKCTGWLETTDPAFVGGRPRGAIVIDDGIPHIATSCEQYPSDDPFHYDVYQFRVIEKSGPWIFNMWYTVNLPPQAKLPDDIVALYRMQPDSLYAFDYAAPCKNIIALDDWRMSPYGFITASTLDAGYYAFVVTHERPESWYRVNRQPWLGIFGQYELRVTYPATESFSCTDGNVPPTPVPTPTPSTYYYDSSADSGWVTNAYFDMVVICIPGGGCSVQAVKHYFKVELTTTGSARYFDRDALHYGVIDQWTGGVVNPGSSFCGWYVWNVVEATGLGNPMTFIAHHDRKYLIPASEWQHDGYICPGGARCSSLKHTRNYVISRLDGYARYTGHAVVNGKGCLYPAFYPHLGVDVDLRTPVAR